MTSATEPRIRHAPIQADALLVVRGDDLDPETARAQALGFRRRFPDWQRWGLAAYYARSEAEIEDLAADQLEQANSNNPRGDADRPSMKKSPTARCTDSRSSSASRPSSNTDTGSPARGIGDGEDSIVSAWPTTRLRSRALANPLHNGAFWRREGRSDQAC